MPPKRILLVDDELDLEILRKLEAGTFDSDADDLGYMSYYYLALRARGYDVDAADGPDQALARLDAVGRDPTLAYDLIILDLMMPPGTRIAYSETAGGVTSGIVLAKHIKSLSQKPGIVMVSGSPLVMLSNVVPSRPDAPSETTYRELTENGIIERLYLKADWTPESLANAVGEFLQANGSATP
jgi:CheY-like chemotaxis protein